MTSLPTNNVFFILGIIFIFIAVLGQTKLGFAEINPGCFGRTLALFIGLFSLAIALGSGTPPLESLNLLIQYLTNQLQNLSGFANDLLGS